MMARRPIATLGVSILLAGSAACGNQDNVPAPELLTPAIACSPPAQGDFATFNVISEVSVRVEDPDRDLVSVTGVLGGVLLGELTDVDADRFYTWTPPMDQDAIACPPDARFVVTITATDQAGNSTQETFEVLP
ncbi:MAG: hypothetical protein AAGI01_18460 [Myxococcota bacterium]